MDHDDPMSPISGVLSRPGLGRCGFSCILTGSTCHRCMLLPDIGVPAMPFVTRLRHKDEDRPLAGRRRH